MNYRLTELGELALNVPVSKLPNGLKDGAGIFGMVLLVLLVAGLVLNRLRFSAVEVFFVAYLGILFVWPFTDTRFWLPVVPLVAAYAGLSVRSVIQHGFPRLIVGSYVAVFVAAGLASLAYSTRVSFAGSRFAEQYGGGSMAAAYCVVFDCARPVDGAEPDARAVHLLQVFR